MASLRKSDGLVKPLWTKKEKRPTRGASSRLSEWFVAERQGFEPWVPVKGQRFSRPPRSTTPAPLRGADGAHNRVFVPWQPPNRNRSAFAFPGADHGLHSLHDDDRFNSLPGAHRGCSDSRPWIDPCGPRDDPAGRRAARRTRPGRGLSQDHRFRRGAGQHRAQRRRRAADAGDRRRRVRIGMDPADERGVRHRHHARDGAGCSRKGARPGGSGPCGGVLCLGSGPAPRRGRKCLAHDGG